MYLNIWTICAGGLFVYFLLVGCFLVKCRLSQNEMIAVDSIMLTFCITIPQVVYVSLSPNYVFDVLIFDFLGGVFGLGVFFSILLIISSIGFCSAIRCTVDDCVKAVECKWADLVIKRITVGSVGVAFSMLSVLLVTGIQGESA